MLRCEGMKVVNEEGEQVVMRGVSQLRLTAVGTA